MAPGIAPSYDAPSNEAVQIWVNWAYVKLLGLEGVASSETLAADAVATVLPQSGGRIVAAAVAVSAFGVLNAQLLSGPWLILGMARDRRFFAPFGVRSTRGTPIAAIVLLATVAIALILATGKNGIDYLLIGVVFIDGVFFALTGAALFVLRHKQPQAERPMRVPGYPIVPLLFVVGELGVLIGASLDPTKRKAAWIGAGWIAAAAIIFLLWFRRTAIADRP